MGWRQRGHGLRLRLRRGWKIDGRPKKGKASDNALGVRLLFSGLPEGAVVIDEVEVTVLPR